MKRLGLSGLAALLLVGCHSVTPAAAPEGLSAVVVLELQAGTVASATPLVPWAEGQPLPFRGSDPSRTVVVGFRAAELPPTPWPETPVEVAGCRAANLPEPPWAARFQDGALIELSTAERQALPRLRLPRSCPEQPSLLESLVIDARCLDPGCVQVVGNDPCNFQLDFGACQSADQLNPGVVSAEITADGEVLVNWACGGWTCTAAAAPRPPASAFDCKENNCSIDLYAQAEPLPIVVDDLEIFPVERQAQPYPIAERFELTPYHLFEGYLQGMALQGDHLLLVGSDPSLAGCREEAPAQSSLYRVGLEDLAVTRLGPLPRCTYALTADPEGPGFYAVFEADSGWMVGRFDAVGTLTASTALRQLDGGTSVPLVPPVDEVGSVVTRPSGDSFEVWVLGTVIPDGRPRQSAIQRFDPVLRPLGEIPLDRGARPKLLITDEPRLIVPFSGDHLIQIRSDSGTEEIRLLGAVGKFTADVFPLANGALTASINEHFYYVEPPSGARRSQRLLLPSTRFLTQRDWVEVMPNGHRPVLVAGSSRPGTEPRATLRFFEPEQQRFWPGSLDVGPGVVGRLLDDGHGRIWALRPWDAHLLRLQAARSAR